MKKLVILMAAGAIAAGSLSADPLQISLSRFSPFADVDVVVVKPDTYVPAFEKVYRAENSLFAPLRGNVISGDSVSLKETIYVVLPDYQAAEFE